jgi:hypothetical protein
MLPGARRRTGSGWKPGKAVSLALVKNGGVPFVRAFCAKVSLRFCFYKNNRVLGRRESGIIEIALARL